MEPPQPNTYSIYPPNPPNNKGDMGDTTVEAGTRWPKEDTEPHREATIQTGAAGNMEVTFHHNKVEEEAAMEWT